MDKFLNQLSEYMWSWPMLLLFLFTGMIYTIRLRGIQFRGLLQGLRSITHGDSQQGLSSYSSLCTALAATIGTGNIVGVATALAAGGPGALFWMILSALLGMATQFAEGFLAVRYRKHSSSKLSSAGPFSYMELGLGKKWLGTTYALITASAGIFGVGTITQINSITHAVDSILPGQPILGGQSMAVLLSGTIVCVCAGAVILGGAKRISGVCDTLVPLMSGIFLLCSLILLGRHYRRIPTALYMICRGAFQPKAFMGAGSGICIRHVLRMGVGRGVLTNEAGMGTAAIAAGASNEKDPVKQGLISMSATFIDTIVICTISGLSLLVTGTWNLPLEGGQLTTFAWGMGLPWQWGLSVFLLNVCLVFFAFATIIGWGFYAEQSLVYLTGGKGLKLYRIGYLTALAIGPFLTVDAAFNLADILNAAMALPNLICLLLLQEDVVKEVRNSY